jgi:uncharacterized membrane protein
MTVLDSAAAAGSSTSGLEIRRIGTADLRAALRGGVSDFMVLRGELLFLGLIYMAVGVIASAVILRNQLAPLVFPLAASLTLMGPAVASGFYELSRRRELGLETSWWHFFDIFRGPRVAALTILTAVLAAMVVAWMACAWLIYSATLGGAPAVSTGDFLRRLFTTPQGWTMMIVGNLTGLAFAAGAFVISVVSFPMLVDRPVGPVTAIETSVRAVWRNPGTMAAWGLTVAVLLFLGSLPLFAGLAVVLPVLGYASWRLYGRVVGRAGTA